MLRFLWLLPSNHIGNLDGCDATACQESLPPDLPTPVWTLSVWPQEFDDSCLAFRICSGNMKEGREEGNPRVNCETLGLSPSRDPLRNCVRGTWGTDGETTYLLPLIPSWSRFAPWCLLPSTTQMTICVVRIAGLWASHLAWQWQRSRGAESRQYIWSSWHTVWSGYIWA